MMLKKLKKLLESVGINTKNLQEKVCSFSIKLAVKQQGYTKMLETLRTIVPDISNQEERGKASFNDYRELKRRALQAFQCDMMLKALEKIDQSKVNITVVDIGDSAGTHMIYLKELAKGKFNIDTISVNLDARAIKKIEAKGLKAIQCRAEELDLGDKEIDLFTSFQMVEHLHAPALFFRQIAKKTKGEKMVITVPYLKKSRVGLHWTKLRIVQPIFAEDEHIFELCPQDWALLILHAGWKVRHSEIYYQYPRRIPGISMALSWFWKKLDFEGFWGAILEKDTTLSDCHKDWED